MKNLMSSQALALCSLRSTRLASAVAILLSAGIGVALVRISGSDPDGGPGGISVTDLLVGPAQALWFIALVIAIVATASEFHHRSIRMTLVHGPARLPLLLAKVVVAGLYGAVLTGVGMAAAAFAGCLTAATSSAPITGGTIDGWWHVLSAIGLGAGWAVLAAGIGFLTRNTAIAVVAVLLWRFVGEGVVPIVFPTAAGALRWTPAGASNVLVGLGDPGPVPAWVAAMVFVGYAMLGCVAAGLVFARWDPR